MKGTEEWVRDQLHYYHSRNYRDRAFWNWVVEHAEYPDLAEVYAFKDAGCVSREEREVVKWLREKYEPLYRKYLAENREAIVREALRRLEGYKDWIKQAALRADSDDLLWVCHLIDEFEYARKRPTLRSVADARLAELERFFYKWWREHIQGVHVKGGVA